MSLRHRLGPVVPLLLLACSSSPRPAARAVPETATAPPAAPEPAAPPPAAPQPAVPGTAPRSGIYHLEHIDAMNLQLDVEGRTFRLGVYGCDYRHAARGTLRVEADAVVLEGDFTWPESPSVANPVDAVRLEAGAAEGRLRATGVIQGEPFEQVWRPGGVCPECGGGLGPSGERPCDAPYLGP